MRRPATDSALFAVCGPLDSDAASIHTGKSDVSPAAATACGVNLRPELLVGVNRVGCGNPVLTLRGCIRGSVRRADLDARHGLVAAT
jgi:hypothetical protein